MKLVIPGCSTRIFDGRPRVGTAHARKVAILDTLAAFLIVKNEERLLPRCLASLAGLVDELVVLDTGSDDGTAGIIDAAAAGGAFPRVVADRVEFRGFGEAWQTALDRVTADWALCIAADEELSPALRERIRGLKAGDGLGQHDGWVLHRVNTVLGRRMRARCLARDHTLRLVRRGRARFTPSLVHESLQLAPGATAGRLDEPLLHAAMDDWRAYLRKVDRYTTLDALGDKYRFRWWHLATTGPATFWRQYVMRTGFVDGWPGFVWSATSAIGAVMRDWKLLRRTRGRVDAAPHDG
ncbi:MAG: hypothetical protein C0395_06985 [Gemmatimonas sp.]|nr:hypothetical protein [Gemmatimonas sp.]